MCVIIVKEPGVTIPEDKISSACTVNSNGWGLVAIPEDKKPLVYFPSTLDEKTKNDPEEINHYLKTHTNDKILLHLRFRTRGEVSLLNAHPFLSFVDPQDSSKKIFFCHNGTFNDFDKLTDQPNVSDSYAFNELIIKPTIKGIVASGTPFEKVLQDTFLHRIINKCNNYSSVITFMDSTGQHINFNGSQGKQFEGWWASNNYSFNRDHRETKSHSTYYPGQYSNGKVWKNGKLVDKESVTEETDKTPFQETVVSETITTKSTSITQTNTVDSAKNKSNDSGNKDSSIKIQSSYDEIAEMLHLYTSIKKDSKLPTVRARPQPNFYQLCACKPEDLLQLSTDDIVSLTINYPNESALLIKNLLYINYLKNTNEGQEVYVN